MRLSALTAGALSAVATPLAAGAVSSPVALSVAPARLALVVPAARRLELTNSGTEQLVVDVAAKSVDRRPQARRWLTIAPAHLVLRSRSRAYLTLRAAAGAHPGDHHVLVLVTGRSLARGQVGMRLRLGVRVRIRAPGRLVRRLQLQGLRVRRLRHKRVLLVSVANRGNVTEQLRGRLTVTLISRGRVVSQLRAARPRELLPGERNNVALPYVGGARGAVAAVVKLRRDGRQPLVRRYPIRL